jgi:hypothetical protein
MGFTIVSIIGIRLHMYSWTVLVSFDPSSNPVPLSAWTLNFRVGSNKSGGLYW